MENAKKNETLTIEQVDKQVAELEKKHGHKADATVGAFDPSQILVTVCSVISIAVPILQFAKALLFFKKKWQDIIQKVIDVSGQICGEQEGVKTNLDLNETN